MQASRELDKLISAYAVYRAAELATTKWSADNPGNAAMEDERHRVLGQMLKDAALLPLDRRRVLDVGCGGGHRLTRFQEWSARPENLYGIDVLPGHVRVAQHKFPRINFRVANAEALPFADQFFDLVSACVLFSSVPSTRMAHNICREIERVLKPGGAVIWYDLRIGNPMNRYVRRVSLPELRALFPTFRPALRTVTLLPPLARRLGALTSTLYPRLAAVPLLRSHYAGLLLQTEPSNGTRGSSNGSTL